MKTSSEFLQDLSEESLDEDMPLLDWLEYLLELRSDLDMLISATQADVDRMKK